MSEGLNQVSLLGNLGADPELKQTAGGPLLKMRLATEHSWRKKDSNERESRTEWHSLTMFGARAEAVSRYLQKGSRIFIQGHLRTHDYEKEGQKHYRTEVIVDELYFAGGPRPATNGAFMRASPPATPAASELPF